MRQKRKTLTFRENKLPLHKKRQIKEPPEKTYRKHLPVKLRANAFLVDFPGTLTGNYQLKNKKILIFFVKVVLKI